MFIALDLIKYDCAKKGIFGALFSIISKPEPQLERTEYLGARYGVIHAPDMPGGPDWGAVEALAGRFTGRMLLPDGLTPPSGSAIAEPRCPYFEKRVLLATACELVSRSRIPLYRRVLGFVDPSADYADFLSPLLRHYTSVRVVTEAPAAYERAAARVMEELGAPVLVGESRSLLEGCAIILEPEAPPTGAIFAGGERFGDFRVRLPTELEERCPAGIAPHRFAAALHDLCGVEPYSFAAQSLTVGHRCCGLDEAAGIIAQYLLSSPP